MFQVAAVTLWSIRIVVLVKSEYKNKITHVQQDTVKTGIANALGKLQTLACMYRSLYSRVCCVAEISVCT